MSEHVLAAAGHPPHEDATVTGASRISNRWLIVPAAFAVCMCVGTCFGFSILWLPLSTGIHHATSSDCRIMSTWTALFNATCGWQTRHLVWVYALLFSFMGVASALKTSCGPWLERIGPRKSTAIAAVLSSAGMTFAAGGVHQHQLWLVLLGLGLLTGIGLGLSYAGAFVTLMHWFPERRSIGNIIPIVGFGVGAIIGSRAISALLQRYHGPASTGVPETLLVLALVHLAVLCGAAFCSRQPPSDWRPDLFVSPTKAEAKDVGHCSLHNAHRTVQFWLMWLMLCVSALGAMGIIAAGATMIQEGFSVQLAATELLSSTNLAREELMRLTSAGATFVCLLALSNMAGRLFWPVVSRRLGRRITYDLLFAFSAAACILATTVSLSTHIRAFLLSTSVVVFAFGGAFAVMRDYVSDIFGSQYLAAIHGRILTAWSLSAIGGVLLMNVLREAEIAAGVSGAQTYTTTLRVFGGLLVAGIVANRLVRPLQKDCFMTEGELAAVRRTLLPTPAICRAKAQVDDNPHATAVLGVWAALSVPVVWGITQTIKELSVLM